MANRNPFPRTLSGETNLVVNDLEVDNLQVNGQAVLTDVNLDDVTLDIANVNELTLTQTSGNTFNVNSTTPATSILTAASVFRGGVGIVSNLIVGDTVKVNSTTVSVSKTTGALIVDGGIGIDGRVSAERVFVNNAGITSNGDDLLLNALNSNVALRPSFNANGELLNTPLLMQVKDLTTNVILSVDKTTTATTIKKLAVSDTAISTSTTTGCAVFGGGIGVGGNVSAASFGLGLATVSTLANDVYIQANGDSVYLRPNGATINGELINGVSEFTIKNSSGTIVHSLDKTTNTTTLNNLSVTATTASTSTTTGCAIFGGGIGVNGRVSAGRVNIQNSYLTSNGDDLFIQANTSGIFLRAQPGGNGEFFVNTVSMCFKDDSGNNIFLVTKATQVTRVYRFSQFSNTTDSTSSTTGAATFVGGVGISKNTNSVSATNGGALTVAGGIAAGLDFYAGGKAVVTGAITCSNIDFTGLNGTFTPTFNSDTTVTYTTQLGFYYTIGKMVFVTVTLVTTSAIYIGANQVLQVNGLPFNAGLTEAQFGAPPFLEGFALPTSTDYVVSRILFGVNAITFRSVRDSLSELYIPAPTTAATRTLRLSFVYRRG